jgi:phage terminase Nu1 subunit (DNA packaging protein)
MGYFLNIAAISFAYLVAVISSSDSTITLILLSVPEGLTRTLPTVRSDSISFTFF